ncbi:hypothetical protein GTPT_0967 [Tatumella ptyseos ATCC 33301]|uniref:Uncharacterized protein n=1 Tax=Tatumella ptyseos ATCC 33301 TaxID=1005995 RepID=A0A085JKN2_9GAMM|nr:hypothetical protein GTPT_0967 [Tatumella ptyseos ATCC 33301]
MRIPGGQAAECVRVTAESLNDTADIHPRLPVYHPAFLPRITE